MEANKLSQDLPLRKDSVNWDTTENLYIEGDNLEVLKLLESYLVGQNDLYRPSVQYG